MHVWVTERTHLFTHFTQVQRSSFLCRHRLSTQILAGHHSKAVVLDTLEIVKGQKATDVLESPTDHILDFKRGHTTPDQWLDTLLTLQLLAYFIPRNCSPLYWCRRTSRVNSLTLSLLAAFFFFCWDRASQSASGWNELHASYSQIPLRMMETGFQELISQQEKIVQALCCVLHPLRPQPFPKFE